MFVVAMLNIEKGKLSLPPSDKLKSKVFNDFRSARSFCEGLNHFYKSDSIFIAVPEDLTTFLFNTYRGSDYGMYDKDGVLII